LAVLDFRKNPRRGGEARKERQRLVVLLLLVGVIFVIVPRLSDRAFWRSLDCMFSPPPRGSSDAPVDNRLDEVAKDRSLPEDAFYVGDSHRSPEPAGLGPYFPGVEPTDFEDIRDDAPSARNEQECSLRWWDILNRASPNALAKASVGPVSYAQLFQQPSQYRGRLVTVSGTVRRAHRLDVFPNDYGFKDYYQLWLWPNDNSSAPMVIYCLELPQGFPTGMEIAEQAEVTGFFFKRLAYLAKDTLRVAPEILAKTVQWQKRPVMAVNEPAETWPIPVVVCVAAGLAALAAWLVYRRTQPSQPVLPDRPPNFDVLRDLDKNE
jgi:hypothetical protein